MKQESKNLRTFLEQKYNKKLSETEISEYQDRFTKFVELFIEIDQKSKTKAGDLSV